MARADRKRPKTIEVEAKKVLAEMVEEARKANHTWAQIAEALGVTRQAAQARFGGDGGGTARAPRRKQTGGSSTD